MIPLVITLVVIIVIETMAIVVLLNSHEVYDEDKDYYPAYPSGTKFVDKMTFGQEHDGEDK